MPNHFSTLRSLAAAGVLIVGGAASADPITVEYFVQQKAFKAAAATDQLSFDLYEDAQCTLPIGSAQVFVADTGIQYYVDKMQRVRGGTKLPKAVRIHAIIDAPTYDSAPYLIVSGPGVTPVGDACQLQGGNPVAGNGPTGPAGADGAQGPPGADGAQGLPGVDGAQGPPGVDGAQGPPGVDGAQGLPGVDGAQGPPGVDGLDGTAALTVEAEVTATATTGTVSSPLGSDTDRICFLTVVDSREVDAAGEIGSCEVVLSAGAWSLEATATAGAGNDDNVTCSARCLSW